jgi:hypothetical protein
VRLPKQPGNLEKTQSLKVASAAFLQIREALDEYAVLALAVTAAHIELRSLAGFLERSIAVTQAQQYAGDVGWPAAALHGLFRLVHHLRYLCVINAACDTGCLFRSNAAIPAWKLVQEVSDEITGRYNANERAVRFYDRQRVISANGQLIRRIAQTCARFQCDGICFHYLRNRCRGSGSCAAFQEMEFQEVGRRYDAHEKTILNDGEVVNLSRLKQLPGRCNRVGRPDGHRIRGHNPIDSNVSHSSLTI